MKYSIAHLLVFCFLTYISYSQVTIQKDSFKNIIWRNQKFYSFNSDSSYGNFKLNPFGSRTIWDFSEINFDTIPSGTIYFDTSVAKSACKSDPQFDFSNFLVKTLTSKDSSFDYYFIGNPGMILLGACPDNQRVTRYKVGWIKLGNFPIQRGGSWDSDNKADYSADTSLHYTILDSGLVDGIGEVKIRDTVKNKFVTIKALRVRSVTVIKFGPGTPSRTVRYNWYGNTGEGYFAIATVNMNKTEDSITSAIYYSPLSPIMPKDTGGPGGVSENYILVNNFQCNPNPILKNSTINFDLLENSNVRIELSDVNGKTIYVPVNEKLIKGNHSFKINGENIIAGTIFCRFFINGNFAKSLKLLKE